MQPRWIDEAKLGKRWSAFCYGGRFYMLGNLDSYRCGILYEIVYIIAYSIVPHSYKEL